MRSRASADVHAPAGQILNDLVAHRDFQFTNVLGRVRARVPQAGKVLPLSSLNCRSPSVKWKK